MVYRQWAGVGHVQGSTAKNALPRELCIEAWAAIVRDRDQEFQQGRVVGRRESRCIIVCRSSPRKKVFQVQSGVKLLASTIMDREMIVMYTQRAGVGPVLDKCAG